MVSPHAPLQDADDGRRSRRARKSVNYAELNDVYLPPLGPQDFVGGEAAPSAPGTRSRTRRNIDTYIQEDYLAPRVRSTSTRRRWRESQEEGEEEIIAREEEEGKLEEENGTSYSSSDLRGHGSKRNGSTSLSPDTCSQGSLEVITEEDEKEESEVDSTAPNLIQNDTPATDWCQFDVAKKKSSFACLEKSSSDLAPVNILVQQSVSPPAHLPHYFHAPPTKHTPTNFPFHQAPLVHHGPSFHVNQASSPIHHTPSRPVQYSSSLSLNDHTLAGSPVFSDGTSLSRQCGYAAASNHSVNSSSGYAIPPLLHRKEGTVEGRTSASALTSPSLSAVSNWTKPNQNPSENQ